MGKKHFLSLAIIFAIQTKVHATELAHNFNSRRITLNLALKLNESNYDRSFDNSTTIEGKILKELQSQVISFDCIVRELQPNDTSTVSAFNGREL